VVTCGLGLPKITRKTLGLMRPEYRNLHSYFQEIKERYTHAKTVEEKLDLLKIAREILKQAEEQVAQFQNEVDGMRQSGRDQSSRSIDKAGKPSV
jgi:uncharacterized NAD(P)/FAD-binding protein YdhS